ncbi:MAG: proline--tRNA ligase [Ignavibacteriae bacterium]|nr:proline--tRNA ligase [Ignavibacteriota bacterium]
MKLTKFFVPTLKEDPADAVVISHKLMLRAGMIKQLTSGVYSYLPLGLRVFKKIEKVIREEMDAIGGNEFLLPALSPNDLWSQTGRLEDYGDTMFRIKNRELVLAPTHEEVFTSIAKSNLISYKDLPCMWYQIQTKFRNEARPRSGVLRGRQFTMKDAYSFDTDEKGLDAAYELQDKAYKNIFTRCGLKFFSVTAFSGAMGGSNSEEFMVESDAGEDVVAITEDGSYSSNIEVAVSYREGVGRKDSNLPYEPFHTPNIKSIEELAGFLGISDKSRLAKSRVFVNPAKSEGEIDEYILVLVCGDDEVNETKLQNIFGQNIRPGHPEELAAITGADAGSIGPIGLKNKDVKIIADLLLKDADELISGANKNDYHIKNIDLKRDVKNIEYYDIRVVKEGEFTLDKKHKIKITKAIEVGHIFKLGTKYSKALHAYYLDRNGAENPIVMGSYGIGVERIAASYIEQNYDDKGIIWGGEIAPFKVHLICASANKEESVKETEKIYGLLEEKGIEVLYDDRPDIRPGFKFNDADLIGVPLQVIIGEKNLKNGNIEIKIRRTGVRMLIPVADFYNKISGLVNEY